jgi:hypothetical protein
MVQIRPNRVSYLLTPTGIAEKTRMSRLYLQQSITFYVDARNRIGDRFITLSAEWCADGDRGVREKRIVFFGAGELAEIAYVCLQGSDLRLVGVVDDKRRARFFDVPVFSVRDLKGREVKGTSFDRLVVMAFDNHESTEAILRSANVPLERVHWL